jgi:ATP synthase protein I
MMKTLPPDTEAEVDESDFKPLTAQEAEQWRLRNPPLSIWKVVASQALVGLLVALAAWAFTGSAQVGWSAAYGAMAVWVPAALFARGVLRQGATRDPRAAMAGFVGWEIAKVVLTVALLAAATWVVPGLSWIALLVGMVVTMKTYWVALLVRPGVRKTD